MDVICDAFSIALIEMRHIFCSKRCFKRKLQLKEDKDLLAPK